MRSERVDLLGSSVAVGLSCGIGFFLAQEGWRQKAELRKIWRESRHLLQNSAAPWLILIVGTGSWYPLALWCIYRELKAENSEQGDKKSDDTSSANQSSLSSRTEQDDDNIPPHQQTPKTKHTRTVDIVDGPAPPSPEDLSRSMDLSMIEGTFKEVKTKGSDQRYLEMLVHNVSHTDLVLSLNAQGKTNKDKTNNNNNNNKTTIDGQKRADPQYCLCRPRFSTFDLYSKRVFQSLQGQAEIVSFPRYERSDATPRYNIVTPKPSRQKRIPTGFVLPSSCDLLRIPKDEIPNLRIRGRDVSKVGPCLGNDPAEISINNVFFPLLATLLPRWHQQIGTRHPPTANVKKVLILVSGVGTPRNWTHSITGNSTQACAELMERFIRQLYPDVTVVRIHSETNLFRYDENIIFAKRELRPCVDAYRDAHATGQAYPDEPKYPKDLLLGDKPFSPDWKQSFHLTLSFADGSPARTHAIQAAVRSYRPVYFHFWQLKSFWHDTKIVDDDLEVYSFEDMETVPAIDANNVADEEANLVVDEMRNFRNEFLTMLEGRNDLKQFWLRKTRKPVLAVLLVQPPGKKPVLYRGTNMEVSMPTGSLCAERNVIGTALATNPGLKREDLRKVAVLAVPLPAEIGGDSVRPHRMSRSVSLASYSSIVMEDDDTEEWVIPAGDNTTELGDAMVQPSPHPNSKPLMPEVQIPIPPPLVMDAARLAPTPPGTPVRRISLYSHARASAEHSSKPAMGFGGKKGKRTVLVHSNEVC